MITQSPLPSFFNLACVLVPLAVECFTVDARSVEVRTWRVFGFRVAVTSRVLPGVSR
jgi:hypothetical protein